jgi:hypothetical protein
MKNHDGFFKRNDVAYIILIFKTARVARLVPATTVVNLSASLNLYWYLVRLTPCFYWRVFLRRREDANRVNKEIKVNKNSSMIRSSWGGLEIATMATIKAMSDKEENNAKERGKIAYAGYKIKKWSEHSKQYHFAHAHACVCVCVCVCNLHMISYSSLTSSHTELWITPTTTFV